MQKINCLIVDDEPIARDIIMTYSSHIPELQVVASCTNALEAKSILQQQKIDILFLDINMPVLDGITFVQILKALNNQPRIIFTTAYKEYALNAFDLAACDYLLKPFSLERFIIAVDKAMKELSLPINSLYEETGTTTETYTFIKSIGKIYKVQYTDLLFAEASGNYTKIVTRQITLLPAITFTGFGEGLPKSMFLRVHRSFIINKSKITYIEGNRIFIDKHEIPIGSNYKNDLLREIGL